MCFCASGVESGGVPFIRMFRGVDLALLCRFAAMSRQRLGYKPRSSGRVGLHPKVAYP